MTLLKSGKIWIFLKGLTHGFGQNFNIFLAFVFFRIRLKIMFDFVREKKEGFLDYKNDIRKRSKNWVFLKGLAHGFNQNFNIFYQIVFL